ncbi:Sodium channel protein Nach, partial [Gryllus bimaculatus]
MVFRPRDFADTTAGGALEQLVTINTDVFMRLDSVTLKSTDAVRSFSLEQRRCLFESEVADFYGYYSYPECLTDCRAWSIRALCGCLSFFIPKRGAFPDCGPRDVACMGRYTSKWHSLRPPAILPGLK